MSFLELLIPPPLVALLAGAAMWGGTMVAPLASGPRFRIPLAIAIAVAGLAVSTSGFGGSMAAGMGALGVAAGVGVAGTGVGVTVGAVTVGRSLWNNTLGACHR